MAYTAVTVLLENLNQLLGQDTNLLRGLEDKVKSLQKKLQIILGFLSDIEGQENEQEALKAVVGQIRDVAYYAEDVIDKHVYNVAKLNRRSNVFFKMRHGYSVVASKIVRVMMEIDEINSNQRSFGIAPRRRGESSSFAAPRQSQVSFTEDVYVVGLNDEVGMLTAKLVEGDMDLEIISIVGMGGLGKTCLARKVYKEKILNKHFKLKVWIYVSPGFQISQLLQAILECIDPNLSRNLDETRLGRKVYKSLLSKRFLIVLDDVWNTRVLDEINVFIPKEKNGSRILLTTRLMGVANYPSIRSYQHHLRFLTEEESWELFSRKVFQGESCPSELDEVGKKIVHQCHGLPLAIMIIADLLSGKEKAFHKWHKVASNVSIYLDPVSNVSALSYNSLPQNLKACFLYLAVFPADFDIPVRQLIRLWIVEGLVVVRGSDTETVEYTAKENLQGLIDRNLIQVTSKRSNGEVKTCRFHNLLRHLCISLANDENFLQLHYNRTSNFTSSSLAKPRRVAIHSQSHSPSSLFENIISDLPATHIRSLLFFPPSDAHQLKRDIFLYLIKEFKLLRVLDLGTLIVQHLPDEIETLVHLRYLRVSIPSISILPKYLSSLRNLQILDIRSSCIRPLPIGIWKMKQLRHLYFGRDTTLPNPAYPEDVLMNLQTISTLSPESCVEGILSKFPNLIKLGIYGELNNFISGSAPVSSFNSLVKLENLLTLKLVKGPDYPPVLQLPIWDQFPAQITKVTLIETKLESDPMPTLEKLPSLEILKLGKESYDGNKLSCTPNGFPQLRFLLFESLNITEFELGQGSMLKLEHLVVRKCGQLWDPHPSVDDISFFGEMKNMSNLTEMELWWPSTNSERLARKAQESYPGRLNVLISSPDS